MRYLATLCPHCGWNLDGSADGVVLHCGNCHRAFEIAANALNEVVWSMTSNDAAGVKLPFWKLTGTIPALGMSSFGDLVEAADVHLPAGSTVQEQRLSFFVPGFKIRPKYFLLSAQRATLGQHGLRPGSRWANRSKRLLHPVTLSSREAGQAIKVVLASVIKNRKALYPTLPMARFEVEATELVYVDFADRGYDMHTPDLGIALAKNVLNFGRSM